MWGPNFNDWSTVQTLVVELISGLSNLDLNKNNPYLDTLINDQLPIKAISRLILILVVLTFDKLKKGLGFTVTYEKLM
jgi:hypothetical protein